MPQPRPAGRWAVGGPPGDGRVVEIEPPVYRISETFRPGPEAGQDASGRAVCAAFAGLATRCDPVADDVSVLPRPRRAAGRPERPGGSRTLPPPGKQPRRSQPPPGAREPPRS